jgi:hypothetical protein
MAFDMVDADQPHGVCWVTILPHKSTRPSRSFRLQASEDPERYGYFLEQFDLLWKSCRIERLPRPTGQQQLVVHSATYGVKGKTVDVAELVRSKIFQGRLELLVCNEVLVDEDPVPGKRKHLTVDYSYAGRRDSVVITEGDTLSLPRMEGAVHR